MPISRSIASVASALVVVALCLVPRSAAAEDKRVVVLDLSGPKAAKFTKPIIKLVKAKHTYVSAKRFTRAAKKVRGFEPDADGMSKVARKLKADAIVDGNVAKKGRKYKLTLTVLDGGTGEPVGEPISVTVTRPGLKGAALAKVKKKLFAAIAEASGPAQDDEPPAEVVVAGAEDEPLDGAAEVPDDKGDERVADAGGDDAEPVVVASEPLSATDRADLAARGRAVELAAGLAFVGRNLSFSLSKQVADTPQGYRGAMVPGLFVGGELYPMAMGQPGRGVIKNLGLSFEFERILKINSRLENMADVVLSTTQQRFGVGALYRWNFGSSPTSPSLKIGAAFNKATFEIDRAGVPPGVVVDIPNVTYTYLSPGLEVRFPFTSKLAITAEGHYFVVTALGDMQQTTQYGAAAITAFDADLGAELKITSSILARAGVRMARFKMKFDGSGALTDRDADAMQDVSSAADRYLGGYVIVGYLY